MYLPHPLTPLAALGCAEGWHPWPCRVPLLSLRCRGFLAHRWGRGELGRGESPAALPAPTAKVCKIEFSPRNCPRRGGGEEGSERDPPPRLAHPGQGTSSARGKPAALGPAGRADARWVSPTPYRSRSTSALEPWPRSQERLTAGVGVELQGLGQWGRTKGAEAGAPQDRGWPVPNPSGAARP